MWQAIKMEIVSQVSLGWVEPWVLADVSGKKYNFGETETSSYFTADERFSHKSTTA